ncbi:hypothetical protein FNJ84_13415 [Paracoccus sp. M683]|nr:hypothetical protein [Paracoccus sp. M683]TRW96278.1 hypothetical protein FNJ84_13415 [Paracoccus sp. M683]
MSKEHHTFTWQGIEIELIYEPKAYGGATAHLEVRSIKPESAPLPITETGYLSHYHPVGTVEANAGTLIEQVKWWLDERAKSKEWQRHVEQSRQLCLF